MKKLLLITVFVSFVSLTFAEVVVLKSGRTIEGEILEKTSGYIKINFRGVTLTYFLDEIDSINGEKIVPITVVDRIDKKDLLERIKATCKDAKRIQIKRIRDENIKGLLHSKTEEILEIDYEEGIMHHTAKIKDGKFYTDFHDLLIEREMAEFRRKGVSSEKIQQMKKSLDELRQKTVDTLTEKMKGKEFETYFTDEMVYTRFGDRWVKTESPFSIKEMREFLQAEVDEEDFKQMLADSPEEMREILKLLFIWNKNFYDVSAVTTISEDIFEGKPCYILDIREDIFDILKGSLFSIPNKGMSSDTKFFTYKEFISKDNYLKLGSYLNLAISIFNPKSWMKTIEGDLVIEEIYSYPKEKISLPPELAQAVPVEESEEIIMQDMQGMFDILDFERHLKDGFKFER